ncbi:MAG TPA: DNA-directed RNA polymerase subunit alpha [Dehalococcoidia bacterium]|jgi:DNA-directed RNA polymerase subunit alpha|nr:DNA-directed RNA polymerase subunit alpha [Chloroflexota bacterium]MDP5877272.1 DNA-directed RNA polymerase subunit alpha [Dehalococcoidia bacterium]MDP6273662.1 DNA-directed RNA polymerase subunit alpha [Dehalococcoidia bacterium]MDP7159933.1 DNA-directed RNA polymerase subunit alpha [Dehalococcoidia bacterium]MDP7212451.1 DNA-directed RNA polymerase subunit alpha [Dehalococcoidia bacterium]|tara:strand:+ start:850 stop:1911 length:1062 start_codon:yes stop_codon:yes gene_type:complete
MLDNLYGLPTAEELQPAFHEIPPLGISIIETNDTYGRFSAEPLERGWATTLGNALRRVLLSSLPGTAVSWLKIDGVLHEYSTIPHVKEEVTELLMNIKSMRLRSLADRPGRLRLEVDGEGEVKAGDVMASSDFEIVNPELHLLSLDSAEARVSIEMNVEQGTGYVPAAHETGLPIGVLPVDAVFTPVRKAGFKVEATRVGQKTDLERLVIEVWTDATLTPMEAIRSAAAQLMDRFYLFANLEVGRSDDDPISDPIESGKANTPVESLDLSARTLNCLKRAGIHRVGEVLKMPRRDLLRIRNFGQKSLDELYERLEEKGFWSPDAPEDGSEGDAESASGEDAAAVSAGEAENEA